MTLERLNINVTYKYVCCQEMCEKIFLLCQRQLFKYFYLWNLET